MSPLANSVALVAIVLLVVQQAIGLPVMVGGRPYELGFPREDGFTADKRSPSLSSFSGMGTGLPSRLARFDPAWRHVGLGKRAPRTVYGQRSYAMIGLGR
ncbi:hypothetical protein AAVH_02945 [Aphelenchoides avenae]|nr:hypothetical protein AAVH_02945 [Aphelenchus avenae]